MRPGEYARALFGPEKPAVSVEVEVESGEQRADIVETRTVAMSATGRQSNRYCGLPTLATSLYPKNDSASSRVRSMLDL